jgi:hypothetical protein
VRKSNLSVVKPSNRDRPPMADMAVSISSRAYAVSNAEESCCIAARSCVDVVAAKSAAAQKFRADGIMSSYSFAAE